MKVLDHAPQLDWNYWGNRRCLRCRFPVDEHGSVLARWRWRREMRRYVKRKKADAKRIPGFII